MRAPIVAGLAAVVLISGGAYLVRPQARTPVAPPQIAARAAVATRLINDGVGRAIDQPALVAALEPRERLPGRTVVTVLPTTDAGASATAATATLTPATTTQRSPTAATR